MCGKVFSFCFALLFFFVGAAVADAADGKDDQITAFCSQLDLTKATSFTKHECELVLRHAKGASASPAPRLVPAIAIAPIPVKATPPVQDPCKTDKRLFVRADSLDNSYYLVTPAAPGNAKGASISYTNDQVQGTQTAAVNGVVSYIVAGSGVCGVQIDNDVVTWAIAPWVSSSGTWNEPVKKGESDALKGGADFQLGILAPDFLNSQHYFILSPFAQTDYRDTAHASGVSLAYEPVFPIIYLGQSRGPLIDGYLNAYWELQAQSEFRDVTSPGLTNLTKGNYEWFGDTIRGHLFLFPDFAYSSQTWPSQIANRLSIIGTAQYYIDARSSTEIRAYSAEVQYKLTGCSEGDKSSKCQAGSSDSSAISFEYDRGTDKDTLVFKKQYLAKFSYKY